MMRWAIRVISCNQEIQVKVQQELDMVFGKGVVVIWDNLLSYTRGSGRCCIWAFVLGVSMLFSASFFFSSGDFTSPLAKTYSTFFTGVSTFSGSFLASSSSDSS